MSDLLPEADFTKLKEAIEWSQKRLERPRANRIAAVRQYVGSHYHEDGSDRNIPLPLLKMAVSIYTRQLAPKSPRVMMTSKYPEYRATAASHEAAVNKIPGEINLTQTFRRIMMEALFSMGIAKCGLSTSRIIMEEEYGEPFVDNVPLSNFFVDLSVDDARRCQFMGNDKEFSYEELQDGTWLSTKAKKDLQKDDSDVVDSNGQVKAKTIIGGGAPVMFKERVTLRDVWLPDERLMVTYQVSNGKQLHVSAWDDDPESPYTILGFDWVPGNVLPLAPAASLYDLHELANALFRKMGKGADSQKAVLGFGGDDDESVNSFRDAADGQGILYAGTPPQLLRAGGIDPQTLAFELQVKELFSYFAGNLDSIGGLAPMTDTVGQDKLLQQAANASLRDMGDAAAIFYKKIFETLSYYEYSDPVKERTIEKKIPGMTSGVQSKFGPRDKEKVPYDDLDLDIDLYSLADESPQVKYQKLRMFVREDLPELAPLIEAQGGSIDIAAIISLMSKYADMPEIAEIVQFVENVNVADRAGGQGGGGSKTTESVRRNVPGTPSQAGRAQIMTQALAGMAQPSEAAALGK